MKNITKFVAMAFVASSLVFAGCDDDKEKDPTPAPVVVQKSNKEILTVKSWKVNRYLIEGMDMTNEPLFEEVKNMQIKFNNDGTYTATDATDPSASESGTWEFRSNETQLVMDPGTDETVSTITELKENSLKMNQTEDLGGGNTMTATLELVYVQ